MMSPPISIYQAKYYKMSIPVESGKKVIKERYTFALTGMENEMLNMQQLQEFLNR